LYITIHHNNIIEFFLIILGEMFFSKNPLYNISLVVLCDDVGNILIFSFQ
jgi:hypothetical protein